MEFGYIEYCAQECYNKVSTLCDSLLECSSEEAKAVVEEIKERLRECVQKVAAQDDENGCAYRKLEEKCEEYERYFEDNNVRPSDLR